MKAVCVYVSAAQLVLQTDSTDASTLNDQRLLDLSQHFAQLRQMLSCAVCTRLLNDPYAPLNDGRCQHNVCRLCVRGRKCLRPLCNSCKDFQDFKTYVENRQMRCLLLCYKSLCEHLLGSNFFVQLCRQKQLVTGCNEHMSTQEIVLEGARYEDVLNTFNFDLPAATAPKLQLPTTTTLPVLATQSVPLSASAVTPLVPQTISHMRVHMHAAPKAATPPNNTSSVAPTYVVATSTPTAATIKQEHTSPNLPAAGAMHTSQLPALSTTVATTKANTPMPLQPHAPTHVQSVYVKHLKQNVDTITPQGYTITSTGLPTTPTITYVGPNTPGIVVPIVSSSATTTAPLTIASAKLQSLNRHMAQARSSMAKAATLSGEVHSPLTFKVATAASNAAATSQQASTCTSVNASASSSTYTTATVTSQQIRNPPSIKTVSNGSAMYSVLYTGVGNKITIKRKTDGDEDSALRKNATTSTSTLPTNTTPAFRQQVPVGNANVNAKLNPKRRGCRCGNATATPGKLTCCGQRCPCYVESKSCIGCKCRGCRNPHRPDGGKVRPVIPELACYEIQMADESASLSPNELPVATTTSMRTNSPAQPPTQPTAAFSTDAQSSSVVSQLNLTPASTSSNTATLIPFINIQSIGTPQQATQQQQQQQQQSLDSLQRESVLIQNAEGKYQVVNVFTTGPHRESSASMQRMHSISQLSTSNNVGNMSTVNMLTSVPAPTVSPSTTTVTSTSTLPQMLFQHQHQRQQQQIHKQHIHQTQPHQIQRIGNNSNSSITSTNSISLQLQQQQQQQLQRQLQQQQQQQHVKASNLMGMRAPSSTTQTQTLPVISTVSNTITLSPIIVTSPNNFTPDLFSDSSDEFLSLTATSNNSTNMLGMSNTPARIVAVPPAQASPLSLSNGNSSSGSGSTSGGDMNLTVPSSHLTPNMMEVIEASDV